jgi:hypothetical protein
VFIERKDYTMSLNWINHSTLLLVLHIEIMCAINMTRARREREKKNLFALSLRARLIYLRLFMDPFIIKNGNIITKEAVTAAVVVAKKGVK